MRYQISNTLHACSFPHPTGVTLSLARGLDPRPSPRPAPRGSFADGEARRRRRRSTAAGRGAPPAGRLQPRARAAGVPRPLRYPLARRRRRLRRRPLRGLHPPPLPGSAPKRLNLAAPQPAVSSREASRRALGFVLFWCSARQSASGRGAGGPPNRHLCFCSRAEEAAAGSDCKVSRIYGVAGIIRLLAGESPNFTSHLDHTFFLLCFLHQPSAFICCDH